MMADKTSHSQAFLFDVDKTLMNTRGEITDRTVQALKKLDEAGYVTGVCTGRSYAELHHSVLPLFPQLSTHIVSGGAQVISGLGEIVWESVLSDEMIRTIVNEVRKHGAEVGFSHKEYYASTPQIKEYKISQGRKIDLIDLDELEDWSTSLLTVSFLSPEVDSYLQSLGSVEVKAMTNAQGRPYYDITPLGVTKREGAQKWAEHVGIDVATITAFGDSYNDLEVMAYVGTAIAMGNALPEVKTIADQVIGHTDDDGIAEFVMEEVLSL